jgi:chromosome segregation ATPase
MASENIDIRIREDGARIVKRNIEEVAASADKSVTPIERMKNALKNVRANPAMKAAIDAAASAADRLGQAETRAAMATQNLARGQAEARAASDSLKAALAAGTITQEQYHSSVLESKAAVSVLNAEWNQAQAEVREMSTALDIATAATRSNEAATEALKNAQQRMGATAGMNRAHLSNLAFQIQDVIVALQMGQAPAQVFLQQGGQIGQIMMQAGCGA